jgi:hypothetical protein
MDALFRGGIDRDVESFQEIGRVRCDEPLRVTVARRRDRPGAV